MRQTAFLAFFFVSVSLILFPHALHAQAVISEIMYDFPGTEGNGDHDWIEVRNTGTGTVDISGYRFFEANTNHVLKLDRGSAALSPGAFAVIANATSTFLLDYPAFQGTLFDSSFNLNSSGELLKFCSASCSVEGSIVEDSLTYAPIDAATNNGASLQLVAGSWIAATPTPGSGAEGSQGETASSQTSADSLATPTSSQSTVAGTPDSNFPVAPQIFAYAGKDRTVIVGADTTFGGQAVGLKKEPLEGTRFLWNFGDGSTAEGENVLHHYENPGVYAVALSIASGRYSALVKIRITAEASRIAVSAATAEYIELSNRETHELDISFWQLRSLGRIFIVPKNTTLLPGASVRFPFSVTGLSAGEGTELLYPNGQTAVVYKKPEAAAPEAPKAVRSTENSSRVVSPVPKQETEITGEVPPNSELAAAASLAPNGPSIFSWLLGLAGFLLLASLGAIYLRRRSEQEIDIIEE